MLLRAEGPSLCRVLSQKPHATEETLHWFFAIQVVALHADCGAKEDPLFLPVIAGNHWVAAPFPRAFELSLAKPAQAWTRFWFGEIIYGGLVHRMTPLDCTVL